MPLCCSGTPVQCDPAALHQMKKASPKPDAIVLEAAPEAAAVPRPALTHVQARAAIAARTVSLLNGASGVRAAVPDFLAALLNAGVVPVLPAIDSDAGCLAGLAAAASAVGHAYPSGASPTREGDGQEAVPLAAALAAAGLTAPGVTAAERGALAAGVAAGAGVAALAVGAARRLSLALTAVAALSCEALQADVRLVPLSVSFPLF